MLDLGYFEVACLIDEINYASVDYEENNVDCIVPLNVLTFEPKCYNSVILFKNYVH